MQIEQIELDKWKNKQFLFVVWTRSVTQYFG